MINATQVYVSMIHHGHSYPRLLGYNVAVWEVWALATPLVLWLARRWPPAPPRPAALALHLAAGLALALVHLVAWSALSDLIRPYDVRNARSFAAAFSEGLWLRFQLELVVYASLVAIGAALDARRRLHRREVETGRLEVQLAEAKLHALELQLRPHFLFNTLHTITGYVRAGQNPEAVDMIVRLGDLLHQTLETERTREIPLEREIALLRSYLDIEGARFSDRLEVGVDAAPDTLGTAVPPFVLQPLAENAIRHGVARARGPARLQLTARRREDHLEIDLFNSGPPLGEPGDGVGLRNTRERLRQIYGNAAHLTLSDVPGGVRVRLAVPAGPPGTDG